MHSSLYLNVYPPHPYLGRWVQTGRIMVFLYGSSTSAAKPKRGYTFLAASY